MLRDLSGNNHTNSILIPDRLRRAQSLWGFQRGEVELSPLVVGGVHTPLTIKI
jgi:hypothetical protein